LWQCVRAGIADRFAPVFARRNTSRATLARFFDAQRPGFKPTPLLMISPVLWKMLQHFLLIVEAG
jgi:hypothetical protein